MALRGAQTVVKDGNVLRCPVHTKLQALYICGDCDEVFACAQCVTSNHKKHELVDIDDVVQVKRSKLEQYVQQTLDDKIPEILRAVEESEMNLFKSVGKADSDMENVAVWCNELKATIDEMADKHITVHKQAVAENEELFNKCKDKMLTKLKALEKTLNKCEDALDSGSIMDILKVSNIMETHEENEDDKIEPQNFPEVKVDMDQWKNDVLNTLTRTQFRKSSEIIDVEPEKPIQETEEVPDSVQMNTPNNVIKPSDYLEKPYILSSFQGFEAESVAPASDNQTIWIMKGIGSVVLVNRQGSILREVRSNSSIRDIAYSLKLKVLWICCDDKSVMEINSSSGLPIAKFRTALEPNCLCITEDSSVLIGVQGAVLKYDMDGTQLQTTFTDSSGKKLVNKPYRLCEFQDSGDLAIVDKGTSSVVVLNKNFTLKFRFLGTTVVSDMHVSEKTGYRSGYFPFNPSAVCCNQSGHLLIADDDNKKVIIVSGVGTFLGTVLSWNQSPKALCVHGSHTFWVSGHKGEVNVVEYIKKS